MVDTPFLKWCDFSYFWKARCACSVVPMPVVLGVVRQPVVRTARSGPCDCLLNVVPIGARCAWRDCVLVWSAPATGNPKEGCQPAQPAVAADRCAHEIGGFWKALPSALAAG